MTDSLFYSKVYFVELTQVYFSEHLTAFKCWRNIEIALEEHHVPHGLLPGTNLAWKDIVLCQMWMVNQKRMRGMERM